MSEDSTPRDVNLVADSPRQPDILIGAPDISLFPAQRDRRGRAGRQPLSPLTHILIFSAILGPIALLPYLAVRRQLQSLNRQITDLATANAASHRGLRYTLAEMAVRREEHERLRGMLADMRQDLERFRAEETRREAVRAATYERTRRGVQELMMERQRTRCVLYSICHACFWLMFYMCTRAGLTTLRDMSSSLADIAAFMHEVEVRQGFNVRKNDGRGIEKIRQLAYRLQNLSVDAKVS